MEKISGFSLIRNGIKFDYPFLESWRSLLPLVDEFILNVGVGDDETLKKAHEFAANEGQGKVKIFESVWPLDDPEKRKEGLILSEQTNLALDVCTHDWCFYLQADEVLHEADSLLIRKAVEIAKTRPKVEAIVFEYRHFYGSFNVIQNTRSSYRREMRLIRKSSGAKSVGDAQSFRKPDGSKLTALLSPARIFHYGWVRTPEAMKEKTVFMDQLYHGKSDQQSEPISGTNYLYKRFWGLSEYQGSHPKVMETRIREKGWFWNLKKSPFVFSVRDIKKVILDLFERCTGYRLFEFKNYLICGRVKAS